MFDRCVCVSRDGSVVFDLTQNEISCYHHVREVKGGGREGGKKGHKTISFFPCEMNFIGN